MEEKKGYAIHDKRSGAEEPGREQRADASPAGRREGLSSREGDEAPVIDFSTLIMSFASAAMISLGHMPDPMTGQIGKNLALAGQNIAIISLLQEKTRGNLTTEEKDLVDNILYQLRMSFVESQKG